MAYASSNLITVENMEPGLERRVLLQHSTSAPIVSATLSHDGELIAYRNPAKLVVVEVDSGKILSQRQIQGGISVAFSPDGRWIATSDEAGRLFVLEARTLEQRVKTASFNNQIFKICWDQDSRLLAVQTWGRLTAVVNPWSQETLVRTRLPLDQHQLFFRDGFLGCRYQNGNLDLLNWRQGLAQEISSGPLRLSEVLVQVAVHPKLPLMVGHTPNRWLWFEFPNGRLLAETYAFHPRACRFSEDGTQLVMIDQQVIQTWQIEPKRDSGVIAIRADGWMRHQLSANHPFPYSSTAYLKPDLQSAVVMTPAETVAELDLRNGSMIRTYGEAIAGNLSPLGDGHLCGIYSWHQPAMTVLDTKAGTVLGQLATGPYSRIFADPNVKTIATTNEQSIEFWTVQPLARTDKRIPHPVQHGQVVWHPNSRYLVTQTESSALDIRLADSLDSVGQLGTSPDVVYTQMHFTANGDHLVGVADVQGLIRVWHFNRLRLKLREWGLDWESPGDRSAEAWVATASDGRSSLERLNSGQPWKFDLSAAQTDSKLRASMTVELARAMVSQDSTDPYRNHLAWSLSHANRSPEEAMEAKEIAMSLVERNPDHSGYRNTLGLALYRVGELEEARKILEKNFQIRFGTKNAAFDAVVLALIHRKLGNESSSTRYLETADQLRFDAHDVSSMWIEQLDQLRAEYLELLSNEQCGVPSSTHVGQPLRDSH